MKTTNMLQSRYSRSGRQELCAIFIFIFISILTGITIPAAAEKGVYKGSKMCTRYTLAEGFGLFGSYRINVTVYATRNKIVPSGIVVTVNSVSANHGTLHFSGDVEFVDSQGAKYSFDLSPAWFDTIGSANDKAIYRYAPPKGTKTLPFIANDVKSLKMKVKVAPVVYTDKGAVPLGPEETTMELKAEE